MVQSQCPGLAQARELGLASVPCRLISTMSAARNRACVLAHNKLALNAGWDEELLAEKLGALMALDLDFDVEITGFSIAEIDGLIEGQAPEEPGDPADDVVPDQAPPRCRPVKSGASAAIFDP